MPADLMNNIIHKLVLCILRQKEKHTLLPSQKSPVPQEEQEATVYTGSCSP